MEYLTPLSAKPISGNSVFCLRKLSDAIHDDWFNLNRKFNIPFYSKFALLSLIKKKTLRRFLMILPVRPVHSLQANTISALKGLTIQYICSKIV